MFLAAQHELLLQIIEHPDEDTLRLVLADRLNDEGDPLGELISVQISLERMARGEGQGDWNALHRRELQLTRLHGAQWHQQAAPFARTLTYRRGLPHTLVCSADALLSDGGLTVLAPIVHLELELVGAEQLPEIFNLPLLRRVSSLGLPGLKRFASSPPPPPPPRVKKLKLGLDGLFALAHAVEHDFLEGIEDLELGARWLGPEAPRELWLPAARSLKRVSFTGVYERQADDDWLRNLKALLDDRPGLVIGWRSIEYDATNIDSMTMSLEPQFIDAPLRPATEYNREPFGESPGDGVRIDVGAPTTVELSRLPGGALLAKSAMRPGILGALQSLSLDAAVHLQLPPMPGVLTALAFAQLGSTMMLRYQPWPFRTLHELKLPLTPPLALALVAQLARAIPALRAALRGVGIPGWPRALSRDHVLLGYDGSLKLLAPLVHCQLDDRRGEIEAHRGLGRSLEVDLEGTDDGVLRLLGEALMHLLSGEAVQPRLRPSALNPDWRALDPLVQGCLSPRRAELFGSVELFLAAVNHTGLAASQDAVAKAVQAEQSSSP